MTEPLDHSRGKSVTGVELLAHYELLSGRSPEPRRGFAVLLEVGERRVLLESDIALDAGDELLLNFFLPRAGGGRTQVSMACVISRCSDEKALLYRARVSNIEAETKGAVQRFTDEMAGRVPR